MDLAEGNSANIYRDGFVTPGSLAFPSNDANDLYNNMNTNYSGIRNINQISSTLAGIPDFEPIIDYAKVENARLLSPNEYTVHPKLGYISLNSPLNDDEVLAVAYEFSVGGRTYKVGEFSNGGVTAPSTLILKLIKGPSLQPYIPAWDLMMKNVYSIGAYQVSQADFILDLYYNNPQTSVDVNYLPYDGVNDRILMMQLDLDRLNLQNNLQPDGRFDYVPINYENNKATNGGTIDPKTGRIYFSTIEPFGKTLRKKLEQSTLAPIQIEGIVYEELYDSTKTAAQQIPNKNRFKLKGSYKSSVSSDISLNTLNVPEGSVTVTAGGVKLTEGVDYTVDYNLGRVKILNQGILEAGTPIKVQLESNSLFGFQQKSFVGAHFNYEFNKDFNWGATVMNLTEKPLTQIVNIGDEPM
ncbi:MAG: cell surface protein SprA, partial [Chloroflexia bacterium]|nr:cell surface protein SprA [Chloroflexia bacterium]